MSPVSLPSVSRKERERMKRLRKAQNRLDKAKAKYGNDKEKGKEKEDGCKVSSDSLPATGVTAPAVIADDPNDLVIHLPSDLLDHKYQLLCSLVPECRFVCDGPRAAHNHPVGHFSRQALACLTIRTIGQNHQRSAPAKILCVGLKPSHVRPAARFNVELHHNLSLMAARDSYRYQKVNVANSCKCPLLKPCSHFAPDYVLIWDRIYYLDPGDIHELANLCTAATVVSGHNTFPGHRGGLWSTGYDPGQDAPEFTYIRDTKGSVAVHQVGSRHGHYNHGAADWVGKRTAHISEGKTLGWDALYSRQSLEVVEFRHIDDEVIVDPTHSQAYDWDDDTYYGHMTFKQGAMPTLCTDSALNGAYSVGREVIVDIKGTRIVVSKSLVSQISSFAQGRKVNSDLVPDCTRAARGFSRKINAPDHEIAAQLSVAVALGIHHAVLTQQHAEIFLRNLAETAYELDPAPLMPLWGHRLKDGRLKRILTKLCIWFRATLRDTAEARHTLHECLAEICRFFLGKGLRNAVSAWGIIAPVFGGYSSGAIDLLALYASFSVMFDAAKACLPEVNLPNPMTWILNAMRIVREFVVGLTVTMHNKWSESFPKEYEDTRGERAGYGPTPTEVELAEFFEFDAPSGTPVAAVGNNDARQAYCAGDRYLTQVIETEHGAYHKFDEANMEECEPKKPPTLLGMGIEGLPAYVDSGCSHNIAAAIRGRVLVPLDDAAPGYWKGMTARLNEIFGPAYKNATVVEFPVWVLRYPLHKRAKLIAAREVAYAMPDLKSNTVSTLHVKREVAIAVDGEIPDHDPRAIQARPYEEMAVKGPLAYTASKCLAAANPHGRGYAGGTFGGITYAPGLTAEKLDEWLVEAEASIEDEIAYISTDAIRLDSSVAHEARDAYHDHMAEHFEIDPVQRQISDDGVTTRGHSADQQQFGIDRGQQSGESETTHCNTTIVGGVIVKAVCQFDNVSAIVGGDDSGIVCRRAQCRSIVLALQHEYKLAGFRPKISVSTTRVDMEFCSGRFWSASTPSGFAFGPKPGKLLPKLFYSLIDRAERKLDQHVQGICLGIKASVNHLPVAREFIAMHEMLTAGATPKEPPLTKGIKRGQAIRFSDRIWDDYMHVYGVGKQDCIEAMETINSVTRLPAVIRCPLLQVMHEIDIIGSARPTQDLSLTEECGLPSAFARIDPSWTNRGLMSFGAWATLFAIAKTGNYLESRGMPSWAGELIVAPILEELARTAFDGTLTRFPYFTLQIVTAELIHNLPIFGWRALPAAAMHIINYGLNVALGPYALGLTIPIHILFNALARYTRGAQAKFYYKEDFHHGKHIFQMAKENADQYLEKLHDQKYLSQSGKEWLKVALDPFHDSDTYCDGYPDINVSASIVQVVKQTIQIAVPASIPTGNWDCNIISFPTDTAGIGTPTAVTISGNTIEIGTIGTEPSFAGVTALASPSGTPIPLTIGTAVPGQITLPDSYMQGSARVIAKGFEVVNTTSELNVQGQVIAYRSPVAHTSGQAWTIHKPSGVVIGAATVREINAPPTSAAEAMLLAGSRQWHAKEGGYCVSTLNTLDLHTEGETFHIPMLANDAIEGSEDTLGVIPTMQSNLGGLATGPSMVYTDDFNISGLYFTGLSQQTTLAITAVYYVERFPDSQETDLTVLARPSPGVDVRAMQCYSTAMSTLPPGVMVKENGLGDWFASAVSKVSEFVAPALGMIPHPLAQMASKGVAGIGSFAKTYAAPSAPLATPNSIVPVGVTQEQAPNMSDMFSWFNAMRGQGRQAAPKKKKRKGRR